MDVRTPIFPELIDTPQGLAALIDVLGRQSRIAVDTESNSLHAYRERVCLMQFSTAEHDYVVDPLAVKELEGLAPIFASPRIEKVFHAAEYDIICLRRDFGFRFANIFDTMQAGRILGRKQAGLDRMLEDKFSVTHSKRYQKADWGVRPLSRELLHYAALDTHYLIPLRDLLRSELEAKQLWQLAQEDFEMACEGEPAKPKADSSSWSRLGLRRDLTPRDLAVVKELLMWRDAIAAELDRPPFKVVDDQQLVEIAKAKPRSPEELRAAGLGARQTEKWGTEALRAVARGLRNPPVPRLALHSPTGIYLRRLDALKRWRKQAAAAMDVESDVVLPRALLLALADGGPQESASVMRSSPWRWQRFGEEIAAVLRAAGPKGLGASAAPSMPAPG